MPVQKIKSGRVNIPIESFVGDNGVIFFDESDGLFRLGDGLTPGGISLSAGGGGEGGFILPTASTTVKGGVRVDGTTITIANGVITAQASLLIGPQGLKGDKGDAGANGNDGAPGAAGLNGNDGAPGAAGLNGNDGAPGAAGLNGNDGAPGAAGLNGNDGAPGAAGQNGNDGAPGPVIAATASVLGGVIIGGGIDVTENGTISVSFAGLASENFVNAAVTSAASPINANGTLSLPVLTSEPNNPQAGQIALAHGTSWDPLNKNDGKPYMALYAGQGWIDIGGLTTTDVYSQILELS